MAKKGSPILLIESKFLMLVLSFDLGDGDGGWSSREEKNGRDRLGD